MKFLVCIFALTISSSAARMSHGGGWGGGMVISRRDADAADASADAVDAGADAENEQPDLYSQIDALLVAAKEGITVDDFGLAAVKIQRAADSAVDAQGGIVEVEVVRAAIDDAASGFSGVVAVSSLFDEPLVYEANKMDAALCLLNSLSQKARAQEDAGESPKATVAAISMTAQAMQDILTDTGNVNTDPFGRISYGGKFSHSWNGRRKRRSANQRSRRGEWTGSVGAETDFNGGSVTYSVTRPQNESNPAIS
ncbi:hypothetical protein PoB_002393500 [Plakobranchus ocellatus]|uniref:Uncharacterized protein n=1 Tax=Plakobranchus ocellatus TaxID=259542 RepID=A0AAV3ZNZ5_9GAST|nr:hypothetical protein PoB_002393500 [Plakobranchus ocellatus]